jgi:membrane associated rhomboid family serine protease
MPDLPRRRSGTPSWTQSFMGRLTPAIKALLVANAIVYLVFLLVVEVRAPMLAYLGVSPDLRHMPWQPLTAMFLHARTGGQGLFGLLLDLLCLWSLGTSLERKLGTRRFLTLFFVSGVVANVAVALALSHFAAQDFYVGPSSAILALFVAFARIYGPVPTQVLPTMAVKATHMALFWVAISLLIDLGNRDFPGVAGTIVAVGAGWLLAAPGGLRELVDRLRARRARQRYKVLDGGAARRSPRKDWN